MNVPAQGGRQPARDLFVRADLAHFRPLLQQVCSQTRRRVSDAEGVPASDKLVSLVEPHTAVIRPGKLLPLDAEFGRKLLPGRSRWRAGHALRHPGRQPARCTSIDAQPGAPPGVVPLTRLPFSWNSTVLVESSRTATVFVGS